MRTRILGLLFGLGLAIGTAAPVAADTGGGEADLGLESITVVSATVDPRSGIATVIASVECSQDVDGFAWVDVRQIVGRFFTIYGDGGQPFTCTASDGVAAFSVEVYPYDGKFAGGTATVGAYAEAFLCGGEGEDWDCSSDSVWETPATLRLRGSH